jgi:type II secretory pathway pseudopilin PulG
MRSSLIETFKKPDWVSGMTRITGGGDSSEARWQAFGMQTCLLFISRRRILDNMQRAMESEIARARRPYQTRLEEERDYGDPITNMIMPVFSQGQFLEAHTRTQNAMLALAVALRLYKLEQGRYPDTLSELQTKRFPMLAHDPFAGGAPFRYRKQGETFVLYSIGPDGVDDLGKPIQNPDSGAQRLRYLPNAASRGDIVLGTNSF